MVAYAEQKWPITITTAITIKQSSYLTRVILLNKDLKCNYLDATIRDEIIMLDLKLKI